MSRRRAARAAPARPAQRRDAEGPRGSARGAAITALACGAGALGLYIVTLAPSIVGGDSGELTVVAASAGIAHPPGYPLYTLLAGAFARLPFGELPWRVNLFSALCGAAAAGLVAWAAARASGRAAAGLVAAALLAASPLVWPYAVTAEVFALNNAFAASLVALSVAAARAAPERRLRLAVAVAGLSGLGLANHHTLVFVAAPAAAFTIALVPRERRPAAIGLAAAAGALGLLPYAYLPWAAWREPARAWGDPRTLTGFLDHLLRREYGTFRLASTEVGRAGGDAGARIAQFVARYASSTFGIGPLLAIAGGAAALLRRPQRALLLLWLAVPTLYVVVFASLSNVRMDLPLHVTVQERFWQQALVPLSFLSGVGFAFLAGRLPARVAPIAEYLMAAAVAIVLVGTHARAMDHRGRTLFADWGRAVLDSTPAGALLLATSDETVGSLWYWQEVRGLRPDVRVAPTGQVTRPWFRLRASRHMPDVVLPPGRDFSARALMDLNVPRRPVVLLNRVPWLATQEEGYSPWPIGVVERVLPKGERPALQPWLAEAEASFARFDPPRAPDPGSWEAAIAETYWKQYSRFAAAIPRAAVGRTDAEAHRSLIAALERYVARHPQPDPMAFKNLGVAYQFLAREDPSARSGMARHWRSYVQRAAASDPDLPAIRSVLARAEADGVAH